MIVNRLSADYWEQEIEPRVLMRIAETMAFLLDQATEGGRLYGQVKLPRSMKQVAPELPMEGVPPMEGQYYG